MTKSTKRQLTDIAVRNATSTDKRQEIPDGFVSGLYLVVQPSGKKSWAMRYKFGDRNIKQTIGSYPEVSLGKAREQAKTISECREMGGNPLADIVIQKDNNLLEVVFEKFLTLHVEKKNSAGTASRRRNVFHREIEPRWKGRVVQSIKRRDIIDMLDEIAERAPVMANRIHGFLRKFFNWCVDREYIEHSPMNRLKAPVDEESRDRVLDHDELRLVWLGAERMGYPFGPIVQALILSAQRQQEVGAISRNELGGAREFGSNTPMWTIPKERTKNKKSDHIVPLTPMLDDLFSAQPKIIGDKDFIFTYTGKRAVTGYSHAKDRLDDLIRAVQREEAKARGENPSKVPPLAHWTFHDLRRTAATGMAALKVDPHVIEAVINHKSGNIKGVAAVYNRYQYFDEKYEALLKWENAVKRIVTGEDNVVYLKFNVVNDMDGNA
jgi:integrase